MILIPQSVPAPYDKLLIVMLVLWALVSAWIMIFPRRFVATLTSGSIMLPEPAVWICRVLGVVNMVGAVRFLMVFRN